MEASIYFHLPVLPLTEAFLGFHSKQKVVRRVHGVLHYCFFHESPWNLPWNLPLLTSMKASTSSVEVKPASMKDSVKVLEVSVEVLEVPVEASTTSAAATCMQALMSFHGSFRGSPN